MIECYQKRSVKFKINDEIASSLTQLLAMTESDI